MVQIDKSTAHMLLTMYSDIINLDARMSCSDKGFRRHFMVLVRTPPAQEAVAQLKKAVEAAEQPHTDD